MIHEYNYMPYPALSESIINRYLTCKHLFEVLTLLGEEQPTNTFALRGTISHEQFYSFFDLIDKDRLWELRWEGSSRDVEDYFYTCIFNNLPPSIQDNEYDTLCRILKIFCKFEANQWYSIRMSSNNKIEVFKQFLPSKDEREHSVYNKDLMLYGTFDRVLRDDTKYLILDYKTGKNIPIGVREGRTKGIYIDGKSLPEKYRIQGTVYVMLLMTLHGYTFRYFADGEEKANWHIVDNNNKVCDKIVSQYDYADLFLGDTDKMLYYIARKKTSIITIRRICELTIEIRNCKEFPRNLNAYMCPTCQRYNEDCRKYMNETIFGNVRGQADSTQDSFRE